MERLDFKILLLSYLSLYNSITFPFDIFTLQCDRQTCSCPLQLLLLHRTLSPFSFWLNLHLHFLGSSPQLVLNCAELMASSSSKQLWEHLQEQQKPFMLDVYLSEKRVMLNKESNRTCRNELTKKKYLHITRMLKLILHKLTCRSHSRQVSSSHKAHNHELISKTIKKPRQIGGTKWFSKESGSVSSCASSKFSVKYLPRYENHASLLERTSQALNHRNLNEQQVQIYPIMNNG